MSEWISVEERLPELKHKDDSGRLYSDYVLVVIDYNALRSVTIDEYNQTKSTKRKHWAEHNKNITHWMPLPEPPTTEEGGR